LKLKNPLLVAPKIRNQTGKIPSVPRADVFPYDDFHLKEIMVKLYGLNPNVKLKAQMLDVAGTWGNQKSLAVLYLLSWKKLQLKI
jgi:DNA-3-methyladenine glycosylase II